MTVVQHIDLYRLLHAADAHLGIHSTVLTEAVATGTLNLLADTLRSSDLLGYVDAGVAIPVRDGATFLAALDAAGSITPESRAAFLARHFEAGSASARLRDDLLDLARFVTGRTLFIIPARGGSRRMPGKNLESIAGIPLIGWGIRIARAAARPGDLIICSTDDEQIAASARDWGAEVLDRPAELATDEATSLSVVLHAIDSMEAAGRDVDLSVLVQPTSPLTEPADLAAAIDLARRTGQSVTSVAVGHPATFHHRVDDGQALYAVSSDDPSRAHVVGWLLRRPSRCVATGAAVRRARRHDRVRGTRGSRRRHRRCGRLRHRGGPPARSADRAVQDRCGGDRAGARLHDRRGRCQPRRRHRRRHAPDRRGRGCGRRRRQVPDVRARSAGRLDRTDRRVPARARRWRGAAGDARSRLALPLDAWAQLQAHARIRGLVFLSTPFDDASAALLDGLDVPAFKVGSGELTNLPFLARLAALGRPLIVSTGMATMVEVAAAVDAVGPARAAGRLALLHCVSSYPADPTDANLSAIEMLRQAFGVPAGWSDHTPGIAMPIAAVGLGATIVEKHMTLDRTRRGPDHAMSLEPAEFSRHGRRHPLGRGGHRRPPQDTVRRRARDRRRRASQPALGSRPPRRRDHRRR